MNWTHMKNLTWASKACIRAASCNYLAIISKNPPQQTRRQAHGFFSDLIS